MKKILSSILILLSMTLIGCSNINNQNKEAQNYPRPIDIISVKPIMTCNTSGDEEILATIKNYTNSEIISFTIKIVENGKEITTMKFDEEIDPNSTIELNSTMPNGLEYSDDISIELIDYEIRN